MDKEVLFFLNDLKQLYATHRDTSASVVFNKNTCEWEHGNKDYYQLAADVDHVDRISREDAKAIYGETPPDDKLRGISDFLSRIVSNRKE
jgi:hypothetical protein